MSRLLPILVFLLLSAQGLYSQEWIRSVGTSLDEMGYDIDATADGGFIVGGRSGGPLGYNYWVARFDSDGTKLWDSSYGHAGKINLIWSIEPASNGTFLLAGYSEGIRDQALMYAIDSVGRTLWSKELDYEQDDHAHFLAEIPGGYYMGGHTDSRGDFSGDMWLVRMDTARNVLWEKTYSLGSDHVHAGRPTLDGGCILAGHTSGGAGEQFYVVKANDTGGVEWQHDFSSGPQSYDSPYSVVLMRDGGYAVTGMTVDLGAGTDSLWLIVLNHDGDVVIDRHYGATISTTGWSGIQTSDGGFLLSGSASMGEGKMEEMFVCKTDPAGAVEWQRTIGAEGNEVAYSGLETKDGYLIVGYTESPSLMQASGGDMLIVKLNRKGDVSGMRTESFGTRGRTVSAWPNPVTASGNVSIELEAERAGTYPIRIVDARGTVVRTLPPVVVAVPGSYRATWDLADDGAGRVPAGAYFYTIEGPNWTRTGKIVVQ